MTTISDQEFLAWVTDSVADGLKRGVFALDRTSTFSVSTSDGWTMTRTNTEVRHDRADTGRARVSISYVNHIDPHDYDGHKGPIDVVLPIEGLS